MHALQGSVPLWRHSHRADNRPAARRPSAWGMPMLILSQAQCEDFLRSRDARNVDGGRSAAASTIRVWSQNLRSNHLPTVRRLRRNDFNRRRSGVERHQRRYARRPCTIHTSARGARLQRRGSSEPHYQKKGALVPDNAGGLAYVCFRIGCRGRQRGIRVVFAPGRKCPAPVHCGRAGLGVSCDRFAIHARRRK